MKLTKRNFIRCIICAALLVGCIAFVRDGKGVRLLVLSPKILKYRPVLKKHAEKHHLDWRLMTALIVQESGFNEYAESPAGAKGLTQLMPETAKELGVTDPYEARASIAGATRYFRRLYDLYPESSHPNRVRLALASYNGGRGHIQDAQKIAVHHRCTPHEWDAVRRKMGLLTEKDQTLHAEIWEAGVPPHGYFRGYPETRQYVDRVMRYYERLCYFSRIVGKVKSFVRLS